MLMITCFILCYLSVFVNIAEYNFSCMCVHVENINTNICSMSKIFEISFKITDFLL